MINDITNFPAQSVLEARDLTCHRGERDIFGTLGFRARAGQLTQVCGPNGAGKSTLLKLIAGLLPRASGQINFHNADQNLDHPRDIGEQCHYLSHQPVLKPTLTVEENLIFWQSLYGQNNLAIEDALQKVGLPHLKYYHADTLSAGQHQRVNIARLLLSDRQIWLLDEPTSALDDHATVSLGSIMSDHLARNGIIIAATHHTLPGLKKNNTQTLDIGPTVSGPHAGSGSVQ